MAANGSRADDAEEKRPRLTQRERQVVRLLAEGRSGAQIADDLFLSPETVRTHARNAMSKLGATTRSHAVALALQARRDRRGPGPPSRSRVATRGLERRDLGGARADARWARDPL